MRHYQGFYLGICLMVATLISGTNLGIGQAAAAGSKAKVLKCDSLEVSIPAEYGEEQITLSSDKKPTLTGIKLPSGFCLVSALYKFEPADLRIIGDKKILVEFKIERKMIPEGLKLEDLSIFCLSRNSKQLLELYEQHWNQEKMTLSANLDYARYHFLIGTNIRTAQRAVVKKAAPGSGGGKQCEGGVCPL